MIYLTIYDFFIKFVYNEYLFMTPKPHIEHLPDTHRNKAVVLLRFAYSTKMADVLGLIQRVEHPCRKRILLNVKTLLMI